MNLSRFIDSNIFIATEKFLTEELGIPLSGSVTQLSFSLKEILKERFKNQESYTKVRETYFIGGIDQAAFEKDNLDLFSDASKKKLTKEEAAKEKYDGLLVFAMKFEAGYRPNRSSLATLVRDLNVIFHNKPVVLLVKYQDMLALCTCERTPKLRGPGEKLGKVSLLYNINLVNPHSGHSRILRSLSISVIREYDRRNKVKSFSDLLTAWQRVFNTEVLNVEFYRDYQQLSVELIKAIHPKQVKNKLIAHQGVLNLLNRIMFVYFVQKKKWMMDDDNFMYHFWQQYEESGLQNKFHEHWLNTLFFSAFNGRIWEAGRSLKYFPEHLQVALPEFPFLNGGLFTKNDECDEFILEDKSFKDIFTFFEGYIFTIDEDTPLEINLEVNPVLLGKMYEGMINATDLDDVDAEHGIVYTERPEINFMTRRSFVEVLDKKLNGKHGASREFLYHFIFDSVDQKKEILRRYKTDVKELYNAISSTTCCDPACGSGSMLLGVIQLQMELLRTLDDVAGNPHSPKQDYALKKQLISECIYGVDIKEWAVRIAELRLWLYMIAEANFTQDELTKEPLLPNLDFKLRCGNSLIQKFGSLDFTVKNLLEASKNKNAGAAKKLKEFITRKKEFIVNQLDSKYTYKKLKGEELRVFLQFIGELIIERKQKIANRKGAGKQGSLIPIAETTTINFDEPEIETLQNEIEQFESLKKEILKNGLPFSYDIDFMEIFLATDDPGFDLIIGNPPYVKESEILPPEDGERLEFLLLPQNKDLRSKANKDYKEKLNDKVLNEFPFLETVVPVNIEGKRKLIDFYGSKVPGKTDLYGYFQLLCPSFLNSKGILCFIISNSWLDVDFGSFLQHFLLRHSNLIAFYDSSVRSFDAAVNTVIYLHSALLRPKLKTAKGAYEILELKENLTRFILNKVDYTTIAYAPILIEQEHKRENAFTDFYRVIVAPQKELFQLGFNEETRKYDGSKWYGEFFKAPEIYYQILGNNNLSPLSKYGRIKLGITSCQNDFFYLDSEVLKKFEIEPEYLKPIFKSPQTSQVISISGRKTDTSVFLCNDETVKPNAKKYINYGERKKVHKVECLKGRLRWYSIGTPEKSKIIIPYSYGESFKTFWCSEGILCDKRLVQFFPNDSTMELPFILFLNSSLWFFFLEILGSGNLGEGALVFNTDNFRKIPSIHLQLTSLQSHDFNGLMKRVIGDIFTELGFDREQYIREQQPNPLPDRKVLDDIVFDAIGLSKDERNEIYWSVAELVKQRLDKAASR